MTRLEANKAWAEAEMTRTEANKAWAEAEMTQTEDERTAARSACACAETVGTPECDHRA